MKTKTKITVSGLILFLILASGCSQAKSAQQLDPEGVVQLYFESWNEKNWESMYFLISDGFKKIDTNAKDLATFSNFANSQGLEKAVIKKAAQISNDGNTATVEYSVEFSLKKRAEKRL